ncbi:ion channel [Salinispirillum marinum]|uniref:Ion channel n=2 Tax=Saccharospirillaceae TaxID=255527 RepID=A0ABV8BK72_9GAMM
MEPVYFLIALSTLLFVGVIVILHFEVFVWFSRQMERPGYPPRVRMVLLMFGILALHVVEIWLFAALVWFLLLFDGAGQIHAHYAVGFLDTVYLSAVTYTTVGYGDIWAEGPIRFVLGTEALVGFALITWSASLTFIEMQKHWLPKRSPME